MYRKITDKIEEWYKNSNKALMITGARLVGKTYIVREFLKENIDDKYYVEFNLFENEKVRETIENSSSSQDLLFRLSALSNKPF